MTGHAFNRRLGMSIAQRELGPVVVKASSGGLPVTFQMAIRTFVAQRCVVFVVFLVATDAILWRFLEHRCLVAILALHLAVLAQ